MQTIEGFDFVSLKFNDDGVLESRPELDALIARANAGPATDAIFVAHGFRNDEGEATNLFTKFLTTFRAHLARRFQPLRAALRRGGYWPSKPFREVFDGERRHRGLRTPRSGVADAKSASKLKHDASRRSPKLERRSRCSQARGNSNAGRFIPSSLAARTCDARQDRGLPRIRRQSGSELLTDSALRRGHSRHRQRFGTIAGGVGRF